MGTPDFTETINQNYVTYFPKYVHTVYIHAHDYEIRSVDPTLFISLDGLRISNYKNHKFLHEFQ